MLANARDCEHGQLQRVCRICELEAEAARLRKASRSDRVLIERCRVIVGKLIDGELEIGHGFDTEYVHALHVELEARARAADEATAAYRAHRATHGGDA